MEHEQEQPKKCSDSKIPTPAPPPALPAKRLLFDQRYGFVFDEWQSPSDVALAGGRGMFCIIPLGQALLDRASETINSTASCIINVIQKPEEISPPKLQATLTDSFHKFATSIKPESSSLRISGILPFQLICDPSHPSTQRTDSTSDE